jgi:hypothetical protein
MDTARMCTRKYCCTCQRVLALRPQTLRMNGGGAPHTLCVTFDMALSHASTSCRRVHARPPHSKTGTWLRRPCLYSEMVRPFKLVCFPRWHQYSGIQVSGRDPLITSIARGVNHVKRVVPPTWPKVPHLFMRNQRTAMRS